MADYNPYGTGGGSTKPTWQTKPDKNDVTNNILNAIGGFFAAPFQPGAGSTTKLGTKSGGIDAVEARRLAALNPKPGTSTTSADASANEARRLAQLAAQAKTNASNVPTPLDSNIAKNLGSGTGGVQQPAFTADMLYQDATSAYQPLLDMYNKQQAQLNERYATNAADIKNIFGNLTTVRAQDKAKIAQQFKTSIEQQQNALAARTAEARAGVAAGQQGAATAAAEMGTAGQPVPTDSLTAQAAEQGIADANAYQTTWSALQNVMSQQAQNDVQNAVQGYDYQQTSALETLRNNLEDRLAAIQGNMAGTQSQIAQANLGGKQNVLNAKYQEAQDAKAQAAKLAAAQAAAAAKANEPKNYSRDVYGWKNRVSDAGKDTTGIINSINQAATAELKAQTARGVQNPKLTKSVLQNRWLVMFQGDPSTEFAIDYIKNYSGYGN